MIFCYTSLGLKPKATLSSNTHAVTGLLCAVLHYPHRTKGSTAHLKFRTAYRKSYESLEFPPILKSEILKVLYNISDIFGHISINPASCLSITSFHSSQVLFHTGLIVLFLYTRLSQLESNLSCIM